MVDDVSQADDEKPAPPPPLYGTAAFSAFSDSIAWSFVFPYAAVLGTSFSLMGVMRSAAQLSRNVLQVGWGGWSEKHGKKNFVFLGYFFSGLLIASFIVVRDPTQYMLLIIVQSIFWSAGIPAWNSILGDFTTKRTRGSVLGTIASVSSFAAVTASVVVAVVSAFSPESDSASSFSTPFLLASAASVLAAISVMMIRGVRRGGAGEKESVLVPLRDPHFRTYLTVNAVFWFAASFAWPLYPYVTIDVVHATVWQIAVISVCAGLIRSLAQLKLSPLLDRIGRKPVLIVGRMGFFLFPLLYAFARDWTHLLIVRSVLTLTFSLSMVGATTYILDSAPEGRRGTYMAANNAVTGVTTSIGSFTGGLVTDILSSQNGMLTALFTGLMISACLRFAAGLGYFKIRETL